jgi:hypothetical protein
MVPIQVLLLVNMLLWLLLLYQACMCVLVVLWPR